MKYVVLLIIAAVLIAGCLDTSGTKPAWAHDVSWQGDIPKSTAVVEKELWTQISPYNMEYDAVNITARNGSNGLSLRVAGVSNSAGYPDIYDFTYSKGTLTRTGYMLEAILPQDREAAIAIAMQDREVASAGVAGIPAVRRILPETSKKYYTPVTLLSVTWQGVSVLVDPQELKIVKVWKGGGTEK
ncbi:MAG: hypothetical protein PHH85_13355 [Candidatus Methanoperedens sp.]|nr:hypothetical protein [Candidatus Methanoperedens sp.]